MPDTASPLRLIRSKWSSPVLLACRKCEKKLKRAENHPLKLKKALNRLLKHDPDPQPIHIISTTCMKLCPKGGVAALSHAQLLSPHPRMTILRTREDVATLYAQYKAE